MGDDLTSIEREFPGWHLFRSRPSPGARARLWATRMGAMRRRPGPMTVDGDTPAELRQAIQDATRGDPDG